MPDADPFAAYRRKDATAPTAVTPAAEPDPFSAYRREPVKVAATGPRRHAAPEDFMRPEDIANRDMGVMDVVKGFGKRAGSSVVGLGELAAAGGMIPGVSPAQADPFNPVMRHPFFRKAEEATAPTNDAQRLGGRMEMAAELAGPAIGIAKAVPSMARGAVALAKNAPNIGATVFDAATHLVPGGGYIRGARRLLASALDGAASAPAAANKGGTLVPAGSRPSFSDELASVLDELRAPEPPAAVELPPPAALPPGYAPRATVPPLPPPPAPANAGGRLVRPAGPRSAEAEIAEALSEVRQPTQAAPRVTTPPPAELPPGYTPRSTAPRPAASPRPAPAPQPAAPSARGRVRPSASPPPMEGPPKRAYFLKTPDEIAAAAQPVEAVEATGSIDVADLPASWQARVGQDLFPVTGEEAKAITAALREEIQQRGMTVGQAVMAVSKNKDIPTKLKHQIITAFTRSAK